MLPKMKQELQELMDEECSFATEFEDTEVNYEFNGNGVWLSSKVYLTKGVYVFNVEANEPVYTVLKLYDIVQNKSSSVLYEKIHSFFQQPVIVKNTGYYLFHLEQAPEKWKISVNKQTINN